ncbi:3-oxoacyl-ACP reductase [Orrella marina]|uniref:3-oxoacyl-ACP reductase n=2 Tax=Orrella marina TaxID=2163011 RepID=A0A2R4XHH4_9BURK|nr:SDR family oxidoreductase [Orrella marina]AWB33277.1 3-oxoacyl-ACP reductase [Orrella marina]
MSDKKVALVTGAGSGIGRATALALAKAGWDVVLVGRRPEALDQTKEMLSDTAPGMHPMPTDVSQYAEVQALFEQVKSQFGRLDLLFNNAGRGAPAVPIEELPIETWLEVVNVNLNGMFFCAREAIRMMKDQHPQGGRIINNGSISAHVPRPYSIAYTATKHAVSGLTKSISLDTRTYRIACTQIDIGNAATEMTERMAKGILQADGSTRVEPRMDVNHVAESIVQIAGLPLETNVQSMVIMATNMPFVGRG